MKALVLCCLVLSGCIFRTACVGDSNTDLAFDPGGVPTKWPAYLAEAQPTVTLGTSTFDAVWDNDGAVGSTAHDFRPYAHWAGTDVDTAIASGASLMILAVGTNDVAAHRTPDEIVADLDALCVRFGKTCWVATLPPIDPSVGDVTATNAAIVAHFPADHVVDFTTGMQLVDTLHVDEVSHQLRARRVADHFQP